MVRFRVLPLQTRLRSAWRGSSFVAISYRLDSLLYRSPFFLYFLFQKVFVEKQERIAFIKSYNTAARATFAVHQANVYS